MTMWVTVLTEFEPSPILKRFFFCFWYDMLHDAANDELYSDSMKLSDDVSIVMNPFTTFRVSFFRSGVEGINIFSVMSARIRAVQKR